MTKRAPAPLPTLHRVLGIAPDPALIVDDVSPWFRAFSDGFDLVGWTHLPCEFTWFRWVRSCEPVNSRLMVLASGMTEADGKRWVHVSFSRPSRVPSYADLTLVKERFIGAERQAITIHPPQSQHVSIHAYCLHLWHCVDGDGLPDFRKMGEI